MKLKELIGSGDKIMLLTLPFVIIGLALNVLYPSVFSVGGPGPLLWWISAVILTAGIILWLWAVVLILLKASRGELITSGPYALMKHPIYNGVAILVLPWLGFLLNSWLGAVIGLALFIGSQLFSPEEEKILAQTFGSAWDDYSKKVIIPWL